MKFDLSPIKNDVIKILATKHKIIIGIFYINFDKGNIRTEERSQNNNYLFLIHHQ